MEKAKKNYGEIFFFKDLALLMCRSAKCVGGIGKPEAVCACINKKINSGLRSAQCCREMWDCQRHMHGFTTLVMQWYVSGSYPSISFGKLSYWRCYVCYL